MLEEAVQTPGSEVIKLTIEDRKDLGRIATITFNRPAKRNALTMADKELFIARMTDLRSDDSLRALVLTGTGEKSFVGGTSLAELAELTLAEVERSSYTTHRMFDAVRTFPVPVIARINGYCFGSGMEMAACADMRVGVEDAKFGMPETRFGLPGGMEASVLPRLIGWGKTCELVITGDAIDAKDAFRIGYLERMVPRADLDAAVEQWLTSILKCGPKAVRIQKRLITDWDRMSSSDGARVAIQAAVEAYRSDEPRTLMRAFLQRGGRQA